MAPAIFALELQAVCTAGAALVLVYCDLRILLCILAMGKSKTLFCDYCKVRLAHRSLVARRQHENGRKHIQNKIDYWQRVARAESLSVDLNLLGDSSIK